MRNKKTLSVLVPKNSNALVTNIDALLTVPVIRRYIGWKFDEDLGDAGGWVRKTKPETIPFYPEYIKAIKEGDLEPADKETARLCGIQWTKKS